MVASGEWCVLCGVHGVWCMVYSVVSTREEEFRVTMVFVAAAVVMLTAARWS